jgi:translation elongation factor EF-Tu-like GTPase
MREQKKFDLILKRIMGVCTDPTKKIDVQGTAKLSELDTIDDSFFDISNQELRNIETQINNTLQGNVEFEGCDGIILPIPIKSTLENLDDIITENKSSNKIEKLQQGIDNMVNNPDWKVMVPKLGLDINLKVGVEGNLIVKLPRVVFKSILTKCVSLQF